MELIKVNDVYKYKDTEKSERILWIDEEYSYCYSISLNTNILLINQRSINDLTEKFENGHLDFIFDNDEYAYINCIKLSESSSKLVEISWEIIKKVACKENEPYIFQSKFRGDLVKQIMIEFNISKATIYKYLRKYWQGGKLKVALLPGYCRCGGKGKEKKLGEKKVGRKNYISEIDPNKVGINVTDKMKKYIRLAIKKFYRNHREISLNKAYKMMIAEYFTEKVLAEDGSIIIKPMPAHEIPTFSQFKYWYYKENDIKNTIIERKSEKDFKLNHNALTSNSKYHSFGPGYIYEIDSTIDTIYLVNRIKEESIGRPVTYYVIDVFSKLIAGIFVGVGHPCYEGAVTALYNCVEDKVEYCKQFGLNISANEWVNSGLPISIRADRGELAGKLPENLIKNLDIAIENTASYMGNMKGTVEGNFHEQQEILKPYLDGIIESDFRKRGGSDARRTATMNIEEYTRCVIRAVLYHNNMIMENYPLTRKMIQDCVKPTPSEIWKWGIRNISGSLRSFPETFIKLNLMRQGKATITIRGVEFIGRVYNSSLENQESWSIKARNSGLWTVDMRYDPRCLDNIYIIDEKHDKFVICSMKEEETAYKNRSYDEIMSYKKSKKIMMQSFRDYENENYLKLHNGLKQDVGLAKQGVDKINRKVLTRDIKINKRKEGSFYNKKQAFSLAGRDEKIGLKTDKDIVSEKKVINKSGILGEIMKAKQGRI